MPDPEPTPDPTPDPAPTPDPTPEPKPDPALGPAGESALKAERDRANKLDRELKAERKRIADLEDANLNEVDRAVKAARDEGASEATKAANERILRTEVRAAATGKLTDATDALKHIDLTTITVGDDGEVDTAAIASAIDALLQEKPYLGAGAKPAVPGVPTGARPANTTAQLTQADLKTMSPDQIVAAKAAGQLSDLLAGTT